MDNIVDLAGYVRRHETANTTGIVEPSANEMWSRSSESTTGSFLSARVLIKLDDEGALGRFFALSEKALERLEACIALQQSNDNFGADDELMACKHLFSELLMLRDINDSVGLLVVKLFQASSITAIVDAPGLPVVLQRVLRRLWASPFMKFDDACMLADEIDDAAPLAPLPGYLEAATELLAATDHAPEE